MMNTLVVMALLTSPGGIPGLDDPEVTRAFKILDQDPPIADVQKAALEYFGVTQGDLSGYRAAARLKALLPSLSGTFAQDDGKLAREETNRLIYPDQGVQITDDSTSLGRAFGASVTWDLAPLVFDANELGAYALVGIHQDLVKEVPRLYYTRQHNILALALDPPKDVRAKAALIVRTRELEAMLDAMTGGAWTKMRAAK